MKTPSFLRGNRRAHRSFTQHADDWSRTPADIFGLTLGGIALVLVLARFVAPSAFIALTSPVLSAGSRLSASVGIATDFESMEELTRARDTLQAENESLRGQNAMLAARADDLAAVLGPTPAPRAALVAGVTARPPVAPYDMLILDAGSAAGIAEGQLVTALGGIPIGRIVSVRESSAHASLFSLRGQETIGWAGANRVPVTLVGESAGAFSARIPKASGLVPGDGVYIAAGGSQPIGTVAAVEDDPSAPDAALRVRPFVNIFSVTMVTVEQGG